MDILKKVFQSITIPSIQGYDFEKDCVLTVGQWRVYNAKNKQRLGSVWLCDQSKQFQIAKKEYISMIKLKYPGILQVLEPLVEEKSHIGFVTERIECTLSQALNDSKYVLSDIEMKLHVLEIVDGLQFLHNNVRQVHLDLQPEKIYFTDNGKWKIGGSPFQQQILNSVVECQISSGYNILYTAPEILSSKQQCGYSTDMFSLGMIILRLMRFKNNRVPFPETQDQDTYLKFIKSLDLMRYKDVHQESFLQFLGLMLSTQMNNRPSLSQFVQIEWFKDPYLITFNILNKLPEYDMQQQIVFFKGLSSVIFNFEKSILKKRLLPIVLSLTQYDHLLTAIVQIILETMRREDIINSTQFQSEIWPKLKQIFSGKEISAQVLYDLVLALPVFHKYISQKETQEHLIPLLIKCYECKVPKLQDLGIRVTEFVLENNDYTFSKTKILPRIFVLALDQNIEIRKTTLICIYKTLNVMDTDLVLNSLEKVKALGTDRQLNQIVLKIYQSLSKILSIDQVSQKLLPQITPYLTDPTLSKQEFNEYYDTLQQMLARIKSEKEKNLSDQSINVIQVDYKLALPEPKRLIENKNVQFEFLNQFDQRLTSIPDKPVIQEAPNQTPSQQQKDQVPQSQNQQVPIMQPPTQAAFPIQENNGFNTIQLGQPVTLGMPIDSFQQSSSLNMFNQPGAFIMDKPPTRQIQQLNQPTIQPAQQQGFTLEFNTTQLQQQTAFGQQQQGAFQNSSQLNQGQSNQASQQDVKKLSTRPLYSNNNHSQQQQQQQSQQQQQQQQQSFFQQPQKQQNNVFEKTNDPWSAFNQGTTQDPWAQFQNPVIQSQNQPQNQNQSQGVWGIQNQQAQQQSQNQQSLKNKYASFDELI
ncbi:unnamed protein product (macronuclear) [Paramecium tetraurelia]|uniref:Protein kinase domain-containing protein n=1 Tax=Paramecium tetraurelia TaxID=5888 RepID=A0EG77_PARTE|nr:uncharacterized protein GSPATT00026642001 [Paramecium tetraurelia]CAK94318.1 unnamed protein product [Paramecium tetraurelia]|eukprot:XP_001461691.1 hypothetical protein (macronuclear) [Paramecium tetraurelia strain d4-2]